MRSGLRAASSAAGPECTSVKRVVRAPRGRGSAAEGEADRVGVRADVADFDRELFWRPIDADSDRFEPRGGHLALWPEDRTVLYWWRRRTGTAWWEETAPAVLDFAAQDGAPASEFIAAVRAVAGTAPPADPNNLSGMSNGI